MAAESPGYTVDELAAKVGMSPRNIRAHQTRSLLGAPIRRGRTAYYDESHVRRLEAIKSLQRQGYNLVAIEAILGVRSPEPAGEALEQMLQRLGRDHPGLVHALAGHGVLVRGEDGSVEMVRARLMRSVQGLHQAGVHAVPSLQVLSEVLDRLRLIAEELVRSTGQRIVNATPALRVGALSTWDDLDVKSNALTNGMIGLLTEAFRVALENFGPIAMPELIADSAADGQIRLTGSATIDIG
ncbi:MerR family transcriptional regulator [Actinoplanes sp. NPDC049316]|uniref:MerR family transcriptional regulator n=1 Tax=Actinoplanes sp. NPDC049316 TaxID=3154727 RepID=UPI00343C61AB